MGYIVACRKKTRQNGEQAGAGRDRSGLQERGFNCPVHLLDTPKATIEVIPSTNVGYRAVAV
jgi:hypothetical protein